MVTTKNEESHARHRLQIALENISRYLYKWRTPNGGDTENIRKKLLDFKEEADGVMNVYGDEVVGDQLALRYKTMSIVLAATLEKPRPRDVGKKEVLT